MKHKNLNNLGVLLITILLFSSCLQKNNPNSSQKDNYEVKIACNLPITGDLSIYGESMKNGMLMAMEELNEKQNLIALNFDFQDNQGITGNAVSIYQKQKLNNPDIYISGINPQSMAIVKMVEKEKIPHFIWGWEPFITEKYNPTFRTWLNQEDEAKSFLKFIDINKPSKVAIAHINITAPLVQFDSIIIPYLNEKGIKYKREIFNIEKTDLKDIAAKFKDYNPDAILMSGFGFHINSFVNACRSYQLIKNNNIMVSMDLLDMNEEIVKPVYDDIGITVPTFLLRKGDEQIANWQNKYKKKFGRFPDYTDYYAYDMTYVIYEAAKMLNMKKQTTWVSALQNVSIKGVTGDVRFDKHGNLVLYLENCTVKNGEFIKN